MVNTNSTKPAHQQVVEPVGASGGPKWMAIRLAIVDPPCWGMWGEMAKDSPKMMETAIVSSRARPRPEHDGADHAASTERQDDRTDHLRTEAPSATPPSRSPGGARENTSRVMEAMIGTIMMPTTIPR